MIVPHSVFIHYNICREDKSVEEKFRLDAEMREEAERFKKKVQQKAADVSIHGLMLKLMLSYDLTPS